MMNSDENVLIKFRFIMNIQPLSPSLGSVIHGLNLSKPLPEDLLAELRAVWLDRQVIVLRDQSLSSDQYLICTATKQA